MNTYNGTTTADAVKREALAAEQARAAQHKRDRFEAAKAAMQGLLSNPTEADSACREAEDSGESVSSVIAEFAVDLADALLAELSKCPTG